MKRTETESIEQEGIVLNIIKRVSFVEEEKPPKPKKPTEKPKEPAEVENIEYVYGPRVDLNSLAANQSMGPLLSGDNLVYGSRNATFCMPFPPAYLYPRGK